MPESNSIKSPASGVLLLFLILLAGPATADPAEDRARFPQLTAWIAESERLQGGLAELYEYKPAPETMRKAFVQGGVNWAQRYSKSWGDWLFTDWDVARKLHRRSLRTLKETLHQKKMGQALPADHMQQLANMMRDLRQKNATYHRLFQRRVDINVKQGLELDQYKEQTRKYFLALAAQSATADYHKAMADWHWARAQEWSRRGGVVSDQIRRIGYGRPASPATPAAENPEPPESDGPVILTEPGVGFRSILIR